MGLLDQLVVRRRRGNEPPAAIQLFAGDLSAIPREHAVDVLVVSAFPESYTPNPGTLFASLDRRGLDMRAVATRKAEDERARLGCWLSEPLSPEIVERFNFARILCFEPRGPRFLAASGLDPDDIDQAVGFVFRCLNNFVLPIRDDQRRYRIGTIAMPLLATGDQREPIEEVLPRLLEAATFWLEEGLPIHQLKIVAFREPAITLARNIFTSVARARQSVVTPRAAAPTPIPAPAEGLSWEAQLADAVSRHVIDMCTRNVRQSLLDVATPEERPCAKLKEYTTRQSVIRTVRLRSEPALPLIMGIHSYIDCAERDLQKLRDAAATVMQ